MWIGAPGQRGECLQAQPFISQPGIKGDQGPPGPPGNKRNFNDFNTLFF